MKNWYLCLILCALLAGCSGQVAEPSQENENTSLEESLQAEPPATESEESYGEQAEEEDLSGEVVEEYFYAEEEPISEAEESVAPEAAKPGNLKAESSAASSSSPAPPAASGNASSTSSVPPTSSAPRLSPSSVSEESSAPAPSQEIGGQSNSVTGTYFLSGVETEVIGLINAERRALGLEALKYDNKLEQAARIRSRELYQNNYFAHTRPNGDLWQTVLKADVPVAYVTAGENLAQVEHNMPDYDPAYDAGYWYETWEGSPTHYDNMVRPGFTHVGVGIYYRVRNGLTVAYAATIFASY